MTIQLIRGVEVPADLVEVQYSRASGPGGQHVNKTETRVTLRLSIADLPIPYFLRARLLRRLEPRLTKDGVLLVSADGHRVRGRNYADAWARLTAMLEEAAKPPKVRRPTRPSRASRERRMQDKRKQSEKKRQRQQKFD
ncbi:MAG: alternative ribosome rescue aminoacyl-tRNA hydrolase ArfB [Myxococcota bacterium]